MKAESATTRIVVIGAGYSGMMAALRLSGRTRRHGATVTLVNQSDEFVERIRLHQRAAGQSPAVSTIPHMLRGTGVQFVQGRVTGLDPEHRGVSIETQGGAEEVGYDCLVYALGSY